MNPSIKEPKPWKPHYNASLKQKLLCLIGRHVPMCIKNVVLLPNDTGFITHDHICEWCPWAQTLPDKELDATTMKTIRTILPPKAQYPQREARRPLVN